MYMHAVRREREFWSEEIMLKIDWKAGELTVVCVLGEHRCVQNRCRHDYREANGLLLLQSQRQEVPDWKPS